MHARFLSAGIRVGMLLTLLVLACRLRPDTVVAVSPTRFSEMHAVGSSAATAATSTCPASLSFGEGIQCTINAPGETHTYTFTATLNDKVFVRIGMTSGKLDPAIHILDPSGTQICLAFTSERVAEIGNCNLPSTGNYTLRVDDTYRTNTGGYMLYAQRLNKPGHALPINFGAILTGNISSSVEFDTYTFTAAAGGSAKVRATATPGALRPRIQVYNPSGMRICSAFTSESMAELHSCDLPSAGTYTLLIDDAYISRTGSYTVELECLNGRCISYTTSLYLPLIAQ